MGLGYRVGLDGCQRMCFIDEVHELESQNGTRLHLASSPADPMSRDGMRRPLPFQRTLHDFPPSRGSGFASHSRRCVQSRDFGTSVEEEANEEQAIRPPVGQPHAGRRRTGIVRRPRPGCGPRQFDAAARMSTGQGRPAVHHRPPELLICQVGAVAVSESRTSSCRPRTPPRSERANPVGRRSHHVSPKGSP